MDMYQYNYDGRRWYYQDGRWYASVTSFVKNSLPLAPHLVKWYKDNSAQFIDNTLEETAAYGTQLHGMVEELIRFGELDVSEIKDEKTLKHISSLAQFLHDWEVQPMAIEKRLKHDATRKFPLNFAGTVDLIADTNKGISIIDFKSGGIYDTHRYQMMCYYLAWIQGKTSEDDLSSVDSISFVNVRPKEWRKSPTYEAKIWRITDKDWERLSAMCQIYEFDYPKERLILDKLEMGKAPIFKTMEAEEWINQQIKEADWLS